MTMKFEKIIDLIDAGEYVSPKYLTNKSFVFVSNKKWTNDYVKHYNKLVSYLKERYNLSFEIIGGGKSCSKIIAEFSGDDNEIKDLLRIFNTDKELIELSKNLDINFLIHISNKQYLNFESKIISDTAPYYIHNTYDIYLNSKKESDLQLDYSTSDNKFDKI